MAKAKRTERRTPDRCPCGSGGGYDDCCGPLHRGESAAPTAEALMRSRFSAFARDDTGYLLQTWHPRTRPATLHLDPRQRWLRLDIVSTGGGSLFEDSGEVEFRAHFRSGGRTGTVEERSRFRREAGRWYYLDEAPDRAG